MEKVTSVDSLLAQLVSFDSRTSHDNAPIIAMVKNLFAGFETVTQHWMHKSEQGDNLIVKIPGKSSKSSLVFISHLDTVPPNIHWRTDPLVVTEKNGKYFGLGTCDTKGGIAALIRAVFSVKKQPAYDTYLVFDTDEEAGSYGIQYFLLSKTIRNPFFIAIEPTENKICIAQRSIIQISIKTSGVAQHSSKGTPDFNHTSNAINKMGEVMRVLSIDAENLAAEKDALLGTNTQNFGTINGGTVTNVAAEHCTLQMERRLLPSRDEDKESNKVKSLVTRVIPDADVNVEAAPGFITDQADLYVQQLISLSKQFIPDIGCAAFTAWSEAGFTSKHGKSVIFGPGSLAGQAHKANEFVKVDDLHAFVDIFRKIIEKISLQ